MTGYPDAVSVAVSPFFREIVIKKGYIKTITTTTVLYRFILEGQKAATRLQMATPNITLQPT